jgi:hypothetical protein
LSLLPLSQVLLSSLRLQLLSLLLLSMVLLSSLRLLLLSLLLSSQVLPSSLPPEHCSRKLQLLGHLRLPQQHHPLIRPTL